MPIFYSRCKVFIKTLLSLAFAVCVIFFMWMMQGSRFSDVAGERVFYLQSASSQGLRTERLTLQDLPFLRGESVRLNLEEKAEGQFKTQEIAQELLRKYGAKLLFKEEAAGITSYYAYTARFGNGIFINGMEVNLHIAVCRETKTCVMGSPIIFDGY